MEKNGFIHWSEPEILLYDEDPAVRMSYPDFIEDRGKFFVTETQKTVARVHEIDRTLLEGLWNQAENRTVARQGMVAEFDGKGSTLSMPALPELRTGGFSLDFWIKLRELSPGQTLFDARDPSGKGIAISTSNRFTLNLTLNDGATTAEWDSDPGTAPGTLKVGQWQHVAVVVDGGPKIITWIVDGVLNDGGAIRDFGWGRFAPQLSNVSGAAEARIAPQVRRLRIYNRYLRTSEAVGNYHAGGSA